MIRRAHKEGNGFSHTVRLAATTCVATVILMLYIGPQPCEYHTTLLSVPTPVSQTPPETTQTLVQPKVFHNTIQPRDCHALLESFKTGTADFEDHNERQMFVRFTDTKPGFFLSLHTETYDNVRYGIMKNGKYYETGLTAAYQTILQKSPANSRVMDLGGNIGWFTFYAAALGHHVDVFEPNRNHHIRICESKELNHFDSVDDSVIKGRQEKKGSVNLYPYGVNEKPETELPLIIPHSRSSGVSSSGMGTFRDEKQFTLRRGMATIHDKIKLVSLDHFAEDHGIFEAGDPIAIVKIDVEGFEPNVIKGAGRLLEKHLIQNVFLEITNHDGDMTPEMDMLKSLVDAGYALHKWGRWKGPTNKFSHGSNETEFLKETCMQKERDQCNLWWKPIKRKKT